jgi:hypothetical protein
MSQPEAPKAKLLRFREPDQHNGLEHVVYYSLADSVPGDLFAYAREAMSCFIERRYIASITMASATVELVLNRDSRMRIGRSGWRSLNAKLARNAATNGLPVELLLEPHETFKTDSSARFVALRNQLAHGNLESVIEFKTGGPTDYNPEAREVALNHLNKAQAFVVEWFNGSPDIQRGLVKGHRWPEEAQNQGRKQSQ